MHWLESIHWMIYAGELPLAFIPQKNSILWVKDWIYTNKLANGSSSAICNCYQANQLALLRTLHAIGLHSILIRKSYKYDQNILGWNIQILHD